MHQAVSESLGMDLVHERSVLMVPRIDTVDVIVYLGKCCYGKWARQECFDSRFRILCVGMQGVEAIHEVYKCEV